MLYLFALCILPSLPVGESRPPVVDDIGLGILLTLAPAEPALRPNLGDGVHLQQVDLQVFL